MPSKPFDLKDSALTVRMDGQPTAINLRELRDRASHCSAESIYHHFCETYHRPMFDDPEFTNDFATWAYQALRDEVLAERLGIMNPNNFDSVEDLRFVLIDILEEHLSDLTFFPWAGAGNGFHFMQASLIVFDTGIQISRPEGIVPTLEKMTLGSLYYHFVESRRHFNGNIDYLTDWLKENGEIGNQLADVFLSVDVTFHSLRDLRKELLRRVKLLIGTE